MNQNFVLLAYLLGSLIIISVFATGLNLLVTSKEEVNLPELKYASGSCVTSEDCIPTGCSQELCASEEIFSTCEVKLDAPDPRIYSCGCFNGLCAWTK